MSCAPHLCFQNPVHQQQVRPGLARRVSGLHLSPLYWTFVLGCWGGFEYPMPGSLFLFRAPPARLGAPFLLSCPPSFQGFQTCSPDEEHLLDTLCIHQSRAFADIYSLCDFSFHHCPLSGCTVLCLRSNYHTLSLSVFSFSFLFF